MSKVKNGGFKPNMKTVRDGKEDFNVWMEDLIEANPQMEEERNKIAIIVLVAIKQYNNEKNHYGTKERVKEKLIKLVTPSLEREFPGIVIKKTKKMSDM